MGFGKSRDYKKLPNSNDILSCVSDQEIFEYYLGDLPRRSISSPLREDTEPSFSLFFSQNHNMILFKDFATGEVGDCFVFVMRLFKLSSKVEAFNKVASDFNLNQFELNPSTILSLPKRKSSQKTKVKFKTERQLSMAVTVRPWKLKDKAYWYDKYGLNKDQLEYCKIYPISHYFINGYCTKADELAYAFVEYKDGRQTFKIYQPYNTNKRKWINNNDYSTWELWSQMPKSGEVMIITSSRKDAAVLKTLYSSELLTSVALQSEGVIPKQSVINELKKRFKRIYILYDNDFKNPKNPGRAAGRKLAEQTGFKQIEIPDGCGEKDPSDYRRTYGQKALRTLINNLINK